MYENKEVSTNWIKIGLRIVSVILVVLIILKVVDIVSDNRSNVIEKDKMKEKLTLLEGAGKSYFENDKLPKTSGDSVTVTLEDLVKAELIEVLTDTVDHTCNLTESTVQVFRTDSEYQYRTTLICDSYEGTLNSFTELNKEDNDNVSIKPNEEGVVNIKPSTTKKTTKKATTKKKYTVSFNTNGGSFINDQVIVENNVIVSPGAPKREGYIFAGWYYHGEKFDLNTKIKKNYVLVAKWIKE